MLAGVHAGMEVRVRVVHRVVRVVVRVVQVVSQRSVRMRKLRRELCPRQLCWRQQGHGRRQRRHVLVGQSSSSPWRSPTGATTVEEGAIGVGHVAAMVVVVVSHHSHLRLPLKALTTPQEGPVVKHVLTSRIQGPVVALTWVTRLTGDLYKTVI